ncbi:hypothetical protein [Mycolicibacterium sp.]|uniref:phage fiber-tail adaptor protein n=1 Tax=Mycolicibacterium sp. TaxID=2320850 RepID=UPI00355E6641
MLFIKDPSEVIDWTLDWDDEYLAAGETIQSSAWAVVPAGDITLSGGTFSDASTTITASGGTAGDTYRLENTVTTSGGRTAVRSVTVRVQDR